MASQSKLESAQSIQGEPPPDSYSEPSGVDGEYPTRRDVLVATLVEQALEDETGVNAVRDPDGSVVENESPSGGGESRTTHIRPSHIAALHGAKDEDLVEEAPATQTDVGRIEAEPIRLASPSGEEVPELEALPAHGQAHTSGDARTGALADDDEDVSLDELMISDSPEGEEEEESTEIHAGLSEVVEESLTPPPVQVIEKAAGQLAPVSHPETAPPGSVAEAAFADFDIIAEDEEAPASVEALLEDVILSDSEPASGSEAGHSLQSRGANVEGDVVELKGVEPIDPARGAVPGERNERETLPETVQAKRRDAPLPSFDIPELEAPRAASAVAPVAPTLEVQPRVNTRPMPMPPLSEIGEDGEDDDAVTHIGLPVPEAAANDHRESKTGGFAVADPAIAALSGADMDALDSRRATTRVIPRIDPRMIQARKSAAGGAPLGQRLGTLARGVWERATSLVRPRMLAPMPAFPFPGAERRWGRWTEDVVPRLSMVLFGSGVGALIVLLMVQPYRANRAGHEAQAVQALQDAPKHPGAAPSATLAERARAGDADALYKITSIPANERSSGLMIALEGGYQAQKLREFQDFAHSLHESPAAPSAAALGRFVDFASSPETMLPAFQELTEWSSPNGPDVLYAVWERAGGGSRAASLAQQLLYATDQRAKATPALSTALDLRSAVTCDQYLRLLPAVARSGDQRCSATLRAIKHTDGCGSDGQQDCYACLRGTSLLDDALRSAESRPAPSF